MIFVLTPVPSSAGAVADIVDISCLIGTPDFDTIQDTVMSAWANAADANSVLQSSLAGRDVQGKHYFIPAASGTGISPKWDFTSFKQSPDAFVTVSKAGGLAAPTGAQDVDWLFLKAIDGKLSEEVYRTDTRLGQPPASVCPLYPTDSLNHNNLPS